MKKRIAAALIAVLIAVCATSLADWTAPEANLADFEARYGEQAARYKLIRYGEKGAKITELKDALANLGYFGHRNSENYYRTLAVAVRVFCAQMRIGGDGQSITPLVQAMIADAANMPKAISPGIDVFAYAYEPNGTDYTPYTYARLTRAAQRGRTQVGFSGKIVSTASAGGAQYCAVEMEQDPAMVVYVVYTPKPRTTVFQAGDTVSVFGFTAGEQSFPYPNMAASATTVSADKVGYTGNQ